MRSLFKKLHLPAVVALAGQLVGLSDLVAQNPKISGEVVIPHLGLSPEWAAVIVTGCTFVQVFLKAIHHGDQIVVPSGR